MPLSNSNLRKIVLIGNFSTHAEPHYTSLGLALNHKQLLKGFL